MRVAIPHKLGREEVRRRLHTRSGEFVNSIAGNFADVQTSWPSEDALSLSFGALGQAVDSLIEIEDARVVFTVKLPPILSFVEPTVKSSIKTKGRKLLT